MNNLNFNDIKSTFLSLISKTYPYGKESELLNILPSLEKDSFGNYYKKVGHSNTMFTSHLDTFGDKQKEVNFKIEESDGREIVKTDGNSILGADDKAGVSIMLFMIENEIPGLYYFFIGEEKGAIGSMNLSMDFENQDILKNINKCISFDRRGSNSVINKQRGDFCCSDLFSNTLASELNKSGLEFKIDDTGISTDSASFMGKIKECTNISVGYYKEHTNNEYQDLTFLIELSNVLINIKWDELPVIRELGMEVSEGNNSFIITKLKKWKNNLN